MNPVHAKVSESGRISLPSEFRKVVGLDRGGDVVIELDGNVIRIRTLAEAVAEAQALTRTLLGDRPGNSVDDFLTERRRDAIIEEKKAKRR